MECSEWSDVEGRLAFIVDDGRSLSCLRSMMGEKEDLDVVTMTLTGGSTRAAVTAPYRFPKKGKKLPVSTQASRVQAVAASVNNSVFSFALERLRPGGSLVLAERFINPQGLEPAEHTAHIFVTIDARMGEHAADFHPLNLDGYRYKFVRKPSSGVDWSSSSGHLAESGEQVQMGFFRFVKK